MTRNLVLFINPPNSDLAFNRSLTVTNPMDHSDWSDYPSMGILSLASAIDKLIPELECWYLDGVICGYDFIVDIITVNAPRILAVCVSVLSATYEAGMGFFKVCRRIDLEIATIIGNDYFTALYPEIMSNHGWLIDCGLLGNEVVTGLTRLLTGLYRARRIDLSISGLVYSVGMGDGHICNTRIVSESIWSPVTTSNVSEDYGK